MPPVPIGLIGCGHAALAIHLPILARLRPVRLVAVAEPDASRRAAALRMASGAVGLPDHRLLLERPDVEAVIVCLPNARHAEVAVEALERGKHVYLEKPLAGSPEEADRVVAAWERSGVVGMMGFNYRFNELYRAARDLLRGGRLGDLVAVRSTFSLATPSLPAWKRRRASGGGALLDLGSHHLDLLRFLFDREVEEVHGRLASRGSEDDVAMLQLRLAGGLQAQCLFAFGVSDEERVEVYGSDAKMTVDRSRHQEVLLTDPDRRKARRQRVAHAVRAVRRIPYVLDKRRTPGHEPSYRTAFLRFADAVRSGGPVAPDLNEGREVVRIISMAEVSARTGRPVTASATPTSRRPRLPEVGA